MIHLDLFSGIGGFAYAADQVFGGVEHIFCDNDKFCQQVLKKHWPESEIYDDIKEITADTYGTGRKGEDILQQGRPSSRRRNKPPFILTGGFPCQPYSSAGLRRGTADDRHLWPEMLRVILLTQPTWVIAENVRGLLSWNEGLVFEQVCLDLEAAGYEVQPLIIPAIAVNAPHRRDRVWFVGRNTDEQRLERQRPEQQAGRSGQTHKASDVTDTPSGRRQWRGSRTPAQERHTPQPRPGGQLPGGLEEQDSWQRDWHEVAAELCSVDDGLPAELDGFKLSKPQHRKEQLKAYGNAIVPQVAMEIMKGMI